ncbi:MAG TPA: hypothetical protein VGR73_11585 [Bryobacteraceae bacterium]|nr:hypothetical protein [Bryobacteraceae bacterium]
MWISNRWVTTIAGIAGQLLLIFQVNAADKVRAPVALEGYVRDDSGKPVEGVLVSVSEGSYATQGETDVIPLIFPRAVGAVVVNDPDVTNTHYYNTHFTKTDSNGHYSFKNLSPRRYRFSARGMKKDAGDFTAREGHLIENKKLLARYAFPRAEEIVINGGQTTVKDVVLLPSKLTAVCSVPKPPKPEDSQFIDGFALKAEHGNTEAMRILAYTYQGQRGIPPDPSQAACWFRRAAAKGDPEATRSLRQLRQTIY